MATRQEQRQAAALARRAANRVNKFSAKAPREGKVRGLPCDADEATPEVTLVDGVPYAPQEEALAIARRVAREDAELLRRLAR